MVASEWEILSAIRDALPDWMPAGSAQLLRKGHVSESWLVETTHGPLLARIALRDADGRRLTNAVAAVALAQSAGVPAPAFLYVDLNHARFGRRPFSVTRFVAGQDGQ